VVYHPRAVTPTVQKRQTMKNDHQTARILYVEDNHQNMRLVRKILNHAGYEMLEADTGLGALELVKQEKPALILLDINLPDIDGLEVVARLRQNPDLPVTPVIALTANAMVGDRERMLAAGCDGYLPKPISRQELLELVEQFLSSEFTSADQTDTF
jgi:two-component system, cell cycle response regulator DivK